MGTEIVRFGTKFRKGYYKNSTPGEERSAPLELFELQMLRPHANTPPTWHERIEAFRYIPPFLRLVWQTHHGYTITMVVLRLARAFVPVAALWVGKLIIDAVVSLRTGSGDLARLWQFLAFEAGIVVVGEILARASALFESLLGDLFSNKTSIRLMEHAATLDLYHLEDPAFYDQLERARRQTVNRIGLLAQLLAMGASLDPEAVELEVSSVEALKAADPGNMLPIPVDLVTASGSGLDPHISVAAALYQVHRVAAARGLSDAEVKSLVAKYTQGRQFGILGEPRVNVLELNLALDGLKG